MIRIPAAPERLRIPWVSLWRDGPGCRSGTTGPVFVACGMKIDSHFLTVSRQLLGAEYPEKIRRALSALDESHIWWRPDEESNSIGNLVLHLAGNVRQWIVCGLGGEDDLRDRAAEFAARGGVSSAELLHRLDAATSAADRVIERLDGTDLMRIVRIQSRSVSVVQAVYHVVEHFSMHTGQIILIAKMLSPGTIRFYDDRNGSARPLWKEGAEGWS